MLNMSSQDTRRKVRLNEKVESRVRGDLYARFGGEYLETYYCKKWQGAGCLAYDLMRTNHEVEHMYCKMLENSLIESQQKADACRFETARERSHRLATEHPEVVKRAPLIHIASRLGMSPETLSRVRAGLL